MIPSPSLLALYAGLLVLLAVVGYQLGQRRLARRAEELKAAYTDCTQKLQVQRAEAAERQEQFERVQGNLQAILDQIREVTREAMNLLLTHPWKGNIRGLRGVIENALLSTAGPLLDVTDLPPEFLNSTAGRPTVAALPDDVLDARKPHHVQLALQRTRGNRAAAARLLGISRNTLYRRLREFGIEP